MIPPKVSGNTAALFAYLLFQPGGAREIAKAFSDWGEDGVQEGKRLASLQHKNQVLKYLKCLREKGLISSVPQDETKEVRKPGRPKKDGPKRGPPSDYYTINPKFLIDLVRPAVVTEEDVKNDLKRSLARIPEEDARFLTALMSSTTIATEEDAKNFLLALQKYSPGPQAIIRRLSQFTDHDFDPTILGYLRCIVEELQVFLDKTTKLMYVEDANRKLETIIPDSLYRGPRETVAANMRKIYDTLASDARYLKLKVDLEIEQDFIESVFRFCVDFTNYYDEILKWERLLDSGLELPGIYSAPVPLDIRYKAQNK